MTLTDLSSWCEATTQSGSGMGSPARRHQETCLIDCRGMKVRSRLAPATTAETLSKDRRRSTRINFRGEKRQMTMEFRSLFPRTVQIRKKTPSPGAQQSKQSWNRAVDFTASKTLWAFAVTPASSTKTSTTDLNLIPNHLSFRKRRLMDSLLRCRFNAILQISIALLQTS